MKIYTLSFSIFITFSFLGYAQKLQVVDWENPDVIGINKESPHTTLFLSEDKEKNPNIISLNGLWKFNWTPNPQARPEKFDTLNYNIENWDDIVVPVNWELQGFRIPIYII